MFNLWWAASCVYPAPVLTRLHHTDPVGQPRPLQAGPRPVSPLILFRIIPAGVKTTLVQRTGHPRQLLRALTARSHFIDAWPPVCCIPVQCPPVCCVLVPLSAVYLSRCLQCTCSPVCCVPVPLSAVYLSPCVPVHLSAGHSSYGIELWPAADQLCPKDPVRLLCKYCPLLGKIIF